MVRVSCVKVLIGVYVAVDNMANAASESGGGGGAVPFNQFEVQDREQREEKMRKGRFRLGVLTLFRSLQEKTTAHGLPHVHHARGQHCSAVTSALYNHAFIAQRRSMFSACLLYTSPSPRDRTRSRMPSSA